MYKLEVVQGHVEPEVCYCDPRVTLTLDAPEQMFQVAHLHVMENNNCANSTATVA